MRKNIILLTILISVLSACNTGKHSNSSADNNYSDNTGISAEFRAEHNSRNSVDWSGVYRGTLPCADCEGIVIEIRLNEDNTYEKVMDYLSKGDNKFRESGRFVWDETGGRIIISDNTSNTKEWYLIGENRLIALDTEGNKIESSLPEDMYILNKIDNDFVITEKYWKLIELNGKNILPINEDMDREAYFVLHNNENRISGNAGCNNMMGSYELSEESAKQGEVSFSQLATTRMACVDVDYEQEYLKVFDSSKSYSIKNDTLSLFSEENSPVAVFVAEYLR